MSRHKSENQFILKPDQQNKTSIIMSTSNLTTMESIAKNHGKLKTKTTNNLIQKSKKFMTTSQHPSEKKYSDGSNSIDKRTKPVAKFVDLDKINKLKIGIDPTHEVKFQNVFCIGCPMESIESSDHFVVRSLVMGDEECQNYDNAISSVEIDDDDINDEVDNSEVVLQENNTGDGATTSDGGVQPNESTGEGDNVGGSTNLGEGDKDGGSTHSSNSEGVPDKNQNSDGATTSDGGVQPNEITGEGDNVGGNTNLGEGIKDGGCTHSSNSEGVSDKNPNCDGANTSVGGVPLNQNTGEGNKDDGVTTASNSKIPAAPHGQPLSIPYTQTEDGGSNANFAKRKRDNDEDNHDQIRTKKQLFPEGCNVDHDDMDGLEDHSDWNIPFDPSNPKPEETSSGAAGGAVAVDDSMDTTTTPKNKKIQVEDPFTDETKHGKPIYHIRGTEDIVLDLSGQYVTIARDCIMRDVNYKNENDEDMKVKAKKGDRLCIRCFETYSGVVHGNEARVDNSPPRYYYIESKTFLSIFRTKDKIVMKNVYIARKSEAVTEPDKNIHPLTNKRTQVIFHSLVTHMDPTENSYKYLPGEPEGPGNDINFVRYYDTCLRDKPKGVFKRWEYRFYTGIHKNCKLVSSTGTSFPKQWDGFDRNLKFVYDMNKYGTKDIEVFYIEEFKNQHPTNNIDLTESGTVGSDIKSQPSISGATYIAQHAEELGVGRDNYDVQPYRAFILDDAFSRLQAFIDHNYKIACGKVGDAHKDKCVRCLPIQSKAFYMCHPCIDAKKKGGLRVLQEPVYCAGVVLEHQKLLQFINQLFLSDDLCITSQCLQQSGLKECKAYVTAAGLRRKNCKISIKDFVKLLAQNYNGVGEEDGNDPPQFTHGGIINTGLMIHEPRDPDPTVPETSNTESIEEEDNTRNDADESSNSSPREDSNPDDESTDYNTDEDDEDDDKDNPSVQENDANEFTNSTDQEIQYNEGKRISDLLSFLITCYVSNKKTYTNETESSSGTEENPEIEQYLPTPDEFCKDLQNLNDDLKKIVGNALRMCTGFDIEMHVVADELLTCLEGVNNGYQGNHCDAKPRHNIAYMPLQDNTEPTRAIRINPKMECDSLSQLLQMMDNQADLIESKHFTLPHLSSIHKSASEEIKFTKEIVRGIQTLLLPCFQKDNAIYSLRPRIDESPNWYPCCPCTEKSGCTRLCQCCTKKEACTFCLAKTCKNTPWNRLVLDFQKESTVSTRLKRAKTELNTAKKHLKTAKEAENPDQDNIQKLQEKVDKEEVKVKQKEDAYNQELAKVLAQCQEVQNAMDPVHSTLPKGYSKTSNNFKHYGDLKINLGDAFIVPGECLHYGVTRTNQNLLAVTICPKFGNDIHFSQSMIAHRSLQTFIHVMELYWNDVHKKKMIEARKRLLRWFVLFLVLQSCNQRRVSSKLREAYPKQLFNIVSKIETQFLN
jgi:hypothetical protein